MSKTISAGPEPDDHRVVRRERLLRLRTVELKCEMGRSTIYRKMAEGTFPRQIRVNVNTVRWRESDIDKWIASLPFVDEMWRR